MTAYKTKGLYQAADILEKYGICSETDLSELEQDDFSELESESRAVMKLMRLGKHRQSKPVRNPFCGYSRGTRKTLGGRDLKTHRKSAADQLVRKVVSQSTFSDVDKGSCLPRHGTRIACNALGCKEAQALV